MSEILEGIFAPVPPFLIFRFVFAYSVSIVLSLAKLRLIPVEENLPKSYFSLRNILGITKLCVK